MENLSKRLVRVIVGMTLLLLVAASTAIAKDNETLTFAWDFSEQVDGWKMYDSFTDGGPFTNLVATIPYVPGQVTYESDTTIFAPADAITTKYFVITAFAGALESGHSNQVSYTFDFRETLGGVINFRILGVAQ